MNILRLARATFVAALLPFAALAQGIGPAPGGGSSALTPNSTAFACGTAGSIAYSDGTLLQCAGAVKATSLALGGATIGGNALAVTGTSIFSNNITVTGTGLFRGVQVGQPTEALNWSGSSKITAPSDGSFVLANASGTASATVTIPSNAVFQHGAADVTTGAVAQILTFQGNTGATTTGPLALIRGAGGGSGAGSVGGELRLSGGLSSAAAGTGGAITFYTAPSGAGATPALALTIDSTKLATFAGPVRVPQVTVAGLPSAVTSGLGAIILVTDATACTKNSAVTGGAATTCVVYSNGASWLGI